MQGWRVAGVVVTLKYKYDKKLLRRYTRNAKERKLIECLFVDIGTLRTSTRMGAERFLTEF